MSSRAQESKYMQLACYDEEFILKSSVDSKRDRGGMCMDETPPE